MATRPFMLGLALWTCSPLAHAAPGDPKKLPGPTNVLVIVLDDIGTDQLNFYGETPTSCLPLDCATLCNCTTPCSLVAGACYENVYPRTPRLDALAANGLRFTRYYANPLCSPTRAALMTGRHPFRNGIGTVLQLNNVGCAELDDNEMFLPELLKAGFSTTPPLNPNLPYECGAFGKWHLALVENPATSTASNNAHAVDNGFDRFYGSIQNTRLHYSWEKIQHDTGSAPVLIALDGSVTTPPYTTRCFNADVNRRDARDWINAQTKSFFAYVNFNPPHEHLRVPPVGLLSADTLCELSCTAGGPWGAGDSAFPGEPIAKRRLFYRAMIEAVDTEIGRLLDQIDEDKLANTMVFVIGDNGTPSAQVYDPPHDSTHGKSTIYDGGTRAPLIVSGPLVPAPPTGGHVCAAPISAVDLWRTVAEITGASEALAGAPSSAIDSESFLPYIVNPSFVPTATRYAFCEIFNPNFNSSTGPLCMKQHDRAITDGTYKYIRKQVESLACFLPPGVSVCNPWPCASPGCIVAACPNATCDSSCNPLACATPTYTEELYDLSTDPTESTDISAANPTIVATLSAAMDAISGP